MSAVAFVTGQARFLSFYAALHMNRVPAPDPPEVDFGADACVYIAFGGQRTRGYSRVELRDMKGEPLASMALRGETR